MIGADGFFDWAERRLVPPERIYPWRNTMSRLYYHSLEGFTSSGYWAFEDPRRDPTGWHWTKLLDGRLVQHAPIWAGLAHGGPAANPHGPGGEAEGKDAPLTEAQIQCEFRILHDIEEFRQMVFVRDGTNQFGRLVEHREASQTACPSGRYDEFWRRHAAGERYGDEMTPQEKAAFDALAAQVADLQLAVFAGAEDRDAQGKTLPRPARMERALPRIKLRADGEQGSVADKAESAIALATKPAGKAPPHTHVPGGVTP